MTSSFDPFVRQVQNYYSNIPGFSTLPYEDQMAMMRCKYNTSYSPATTELYLTSVSTPRIFVVPELSADFCHLAQILPQKSLALSLPPTSEGHEMVMFSLMFLLLLPEGHTGLYTSQNAFQVLALVHLYVSREITSQLSTKRGDTPLTGRYYCY